ncbi:MAG: hypothetical protein U1E20_04350 [Methylocystis sp.]|uniref:hypothetical protein n=1 Tax=Methylocystis sp. TaxID=1911079 RepID=UPI003948138D
MNDLIIPPEPPQPKGSRAPAKVPVEIVIDRRQRRPLRYGLIAAAIGLAGVAATHFYPADRPKQPATEKVEARAPQAATPALDEATKNRIASLQGEVQELRAKLDAVEKRQQADRLSAQAASAPPPAQDKAAVGASEAAASPQRPSEKPDAKVARAAKLESAKIDMTPVQSIAPAPKVVSGYRVRDVFQGAALIESDSGMIGVEPGEVVPGVGRVIAIKERAGRWIVVTESGEIIGNANGQSHAPPPRQRQFARELNGFMPRPFPPPPMFPPY